MRISECKSSWFMLMTPLLICSSRILFNSKVSLFFINSVITLDYLCGLSSSSYININHLPSMLVESLFCSEELKGNRMLDRKTVIPDWSMASVNSSEQCLSEVQCGCTTSKLHRFQADISLCCWMCWNALARITMRQPQWMWCYQQMCAWNELGMQWP